jgi:hypothetical protein
MVLGSSPVFRRCSSASADTRRKSAFLIKGQSLLKPNVIDVRVDWRLFVANDLKAE